MRTHTDYGESADRRIGCFLLFRDFSGRVLVVKPGDKDGWQLPGGGALPDEPAHVAALREGIEGTGLHLRTVGPLLLVDYVFANPERDAVEGYSLIFDGGVLPDDTTITLPEAKPDEDPELTDYAWVAPGQLDQYCVPGQTRRIIEVLDALADPARRGYRVEGQTV